jgi:hypothetical protein
MSLPSTALMCERRRCAYTAVSGAATHQLYCMPPPTGALLAAHTQNRQEPCYLVRSSEVPVVRTSNLYISFTLRPLCPLETSPQYPLYRSVFWRTETELRSFGRPDRGPVSITVLAKHPLEAIRLSSDAAVCTTFSC